MEDDTKAGEFCRCHQNTNIVARIPISKEVYQLFVVEIVV